MNTAEQAHGLLKMLHDEGTGCDWNGNFGAQLFQALLGDELIRLEHSNDHAGAVLTANGLGVLKQVRNGMAPHETVLSHVARIADIYEKDPL